MATTNEVEAALSALRSARKRLFELSSQRAAVVERRARLQGSLADLNTAIDAARAEVIKARDAAVSALGTEQGL